MDLPNASRLTQIGDIEVPEDMRMLDDDETALERALGTAHPIWIGAMNEHITVLFRARAPPRPPVAVIAV
jgi:hypothetical protein